MESIYLKWIDLNIVPKFIFQFPKLMSAYSVTYVPNLGPMLTLLVFSSDLP